MRRLVLLITLFLSAVFMLPSGHAQEQKVNQKKFNKDRERKQKQAVKEYHKAVKLHQKNQAKNTKAMMRQSRKQSGTLTPIKR